jgi:hypothetical protein
MSLLLPARNSLSGIANPPDGLGAVIANQQQAVRGNRDAKRASPNVSIAEPAKIVLIRIKIVLRDGKLSLQHEFVTPGRRSLETSNGFRIKPLKDLLHQKCPHHQE